MSAVFANDHEERAWRETWCDRCYQVDEATRRATGRGDGCPLLEIASGGVVPQAWTRRRRAEMGNTYRCADFRKRPPVARKAAVQEFPQEELFAAPDAEDRNLVPVDGWPDFRAQQRKNGPDHQ